MSRSPFFFIEKFNVIGVVEENKSIIKFFDVKTYEKLRVFIDLKDHGEKVLNKNKLLKIYNKCIK